MDLPTEHDERTLIAAAEKAADLVEKGDSPTAAVEKVARAEGFGPGKISLVCNAYNTGRQLSQWKNSSGVLDKLAEFPMADSAAVVSAIYGQQKAAECIDADYARPPDWLPVVRLPVDDSAFRKAATSLEKQAAAGAVVMQVVSTTERAIREAERAKRAAEQATDAALSAEDDLRRQLGMLTSYFRKAAYDRMPFHAVEHAAVLYFGDSSRMLLDHVHRQLQLSEKRAADAAMPRAFRVDLAAPPFTVIRACIKAGQETSSARQKLAEALGRMRTAKEAVYRPFRDQPVGESPSSTPSDSIIPGGVKEGFIGGTLWGAAGGMLANRLGQSKPTGSLVEDKVTELESPSHQNALRKIKAQAMLNSFLTDPEDPISREDPDAVLNAYNQIVQLAPRTAEQPAVIGPLLRKHLHGKLEPFEAKETIDIEKGIAAARSSGRQTQPFNADNEH